MEYAKDVTLSYFRNKNGGIKTVKVTSMVLLFGLCALMLTYYFVSETSIFSQSNERIVKEVALLPDNCLCSDKYRNSFNFCYINPRNSTMIGRRFDCKHLKTVKELGLFDMNYIDLTRDEMPSVCYCQPRRRGEKTENLHDLWPTRKIVVFDLGLGEYRKGYESNPLVDLRNFPFDNFPTCVQKLKEYRWKTIIIAKMLKEFGAIFYIDSSIMFEDSDLTPVYSLLRCKNKNSRAVDTASHPKYLKNNNIQEMIASCNKSSYLFHHAGKHSIFATTDPGTYDFLPMNLDMAKTVQMQEAGIVTVVRTEEAVENIVKWHVLCALEENCMAPPGAQLECNFKQGDLHYAYANCHRYDQSTVNILSANLFNGDVTRYATGINGYLSVDRMEQSEQHN